MKVKLNDKVLVISGKDKGKSGKVMRLLNKDSKVVVEKLNMRTKHIKKTTSSAGEKIHFEAPMSASNVMVVCPSCSKPTRIGYKISGNSKERICKKCQHALDSSTIKESSKAKATTKKIKAI